MNVEVLVIGTEGIEGFFPPLNIHVMISDYLLMFNFWPILGSLNSRRVRFGWKPHLNDNDDV